MCSPNVLLKVIIQCKQYEKSYINVKDIVHEWESKNKKIEADRVIVAIFGQNATEAERSLAKKFNVVLWDEREIDQYMDLESGKKAQERILKDLNLLSSKKHLKHEYVEPIVGIDDLKDQINQKFKIQNSKFKITYSPLLITKIMVSFQEEDFNFKKIHTFNVDLKEKNIKLVDDFSINDYQTKITKPADAKFEKILSNFSDIDEYLIKKSIENSKTKFYFSRLKLKFPELRGIYSEKENEIFDSTKESLSNELDEKIDDVKFRYSPRIEDIESDIADLEMQIKQIKREQSMLNTSWGFRGKTDSEKRRSKEKYHSLGNKAKRKQMSMDQLKSKKGMLENRRIEEIKRVNERYDKLIKESIQEKQFSPEESNCKIQIKKIIWLPKIEGEVVSSKNKMSIILDYKKIKKVGECTLCKTHFNRVNEIHVCSICEAIFCSKDISECNKCHEEICKADGWVCEICNSTYCIKEKKERCHHCNKQYCEDCISLCPICNNSFCLDDLHNCSVCEKKICKNDLKNCPICKKIVCSDCFSKCGGCGKKVCKNDFIKCTHCGKIICNSCLRIKKKLLLFKLKRCVFCIDED